MERLTHVSSFLFVVVAAAASASPSARSPINTATIKTIGERYEALKAAAFAAAKDDPLAERLASDFAQSTVPVYVDRSGSIYAVRTGTWEEVVAKTQVMFLTAESADALGWSPQTFSYDKDVFRVLITGSSWRPWYLGIVVLHEIMHWHDIQVSGREKVGKDRREWYLGEVRAHTFENALLDQYMKGGFTKSLRNVLEDDNLSRIPPGCRWRVPTKLGWQIIAGMWPDSPASREEQGNRNGSAGMGLVFLQAGTDEERIEAYHYNVATHLDPAYPCR